MIDNINNKRQLETDLNTSSRERLLCKLQKAKNIYSDHRIRRPRPLSPKNKIPRLEKTFFFFFFNVLNILIFSE
jgi:hypothetical protein